MRNAIVLAAIITALSSSVILAGTASAATTSTASSNNAAFVINHGIRVGDNCTALNGTDLYVGFITHLVVTSDGRFNIGCVLWGPPIASTLNFNGLLITPSGRATLSAHGVL